MYRHGHFDLVKGYEIKEMAKMTNTRGREGSKDKRCSTQDGSIHEEGKSTPGECRHLKRGSFGSDIEGREEPRGTRDGTHGTVVSMRKIKPTPHECRLLKRGPFRSR
jgi:hypothetical protein